MTAEILSGLLKLILTGRGLCAPAAEMSSACHPAVAIPICSASMAVALHL